MRLIYSYNGRYSFDLPGAVDNCFSCGLHSIVWCISTQCGKVPFCYKILTHMACNQVWGPVFLGFIIINASLGWGERNLLTLSTVRDSLVLSERRNQDRLCPGSLNSTSSTSSIYFRCSHKLFTNQRASIEPKVSQLHSKQKYSRLWKQSTPDTPLLMYQSILFLQDYVCGAVLLV